jgi:hypothetical protein
MQRLVLTIVFMTIPLSLAAEKATISRAEGFHRMWQNLQRPIEMTSEKPFKDVQEGDLYYALLKYAKRRNFFPEREVNFQPAADLRLKAALVWLFRTRNIAYPDDITESSLSRYLSNYPLIDPSLATDDALITSTQLNEFIANLDQMLREETHTVSYYAEEFAGKGTAFGEIFDPNAITAAHKTLPHNTLVRVTNLDNRKQITVRINDRGPYIAGRDLDLSRAAFARIASLGSGVIHNVTFERLGTAELVSSCPRTRYQRRLGSTLLTPGIPRVIPVGTTINLSADTSFRIIQMRGPGMKPVRNREWTARGETFDVTFVKEGIYSFVIHEDAGRRRRFRTKVIGECL